MSNKINFISNEVKKEVYKDIAQPSAKIVGKNLAGLTKITLSPIAMIIWGYERIEEWVIKKVSKKLENIPRGEIVTPDSLVAGPLLENMRFCADHEYIQEMYANLLAKSMNSNEKSKVIPAYVEIVKQLSPLDAFVFKRILTEEIECFGVLIRENKFVNFILFDHLILVDGYSLSEIAISLDNLCRLALIRINEEHFTDIEMEKEKFLLSTPLIDELKGSLTEQQYLAIRLKGLCVTDFGDCFGSLAIE